MSLALAARARTEPLKIALITGASLGNDLDKQLAEAHVLSRRIPFQSDPALRRAINAGEVMFIDQHLSETVEQLRTKQLGPIDVAVIEAVAITEQGGIIPTTSVGNSASFAILAEKVIVEINTSQPLLLEGLHDIYIPTRRPVRHPIPVVAPENRVGLPFIPIEPEKIAAIVVTSKLDSSSTVLPPDDETRAIAGHLIELLQHEVKLGRLTTTLQPLQAGIGTIAVNTALELDIYGNVNSTLVGGTRMMDGIGGSGDFARNAYLSVFVTKSIAKGGAISSLVPMVSHVDHTEHDVDVVVTEQGIADLRGLAPRERARVIIANCAHPSYRDALTDYLDRALARGGHTPHLIEEALSWHAALRVRGTMLRA